MTRSTATIWWTRRPPTGWPPSVSHRPPVRVSFRRSARSVVGQRRRLPAALGRKPKADPERLQSAFAEWDVRGLRWWQRDCHNRANLDLDDQQRSWYADRGVGLGSPWMGGR